MADPRFIFQTVVSTHPPPPPPQWGGGGPPFPAAAVVDYTIYNRAHLFLPYTYQDFSYQYQDFWSPPRQAQQHYYNMNNTRSTYSNGHNSGGNRVQFEEETLILDGQAQQHYYNMNNTRSTYSNGHSSGGNRFQLEDETLILDGSVIHRRQQQHARDHRDHQRAVENIQRRDNQNSNTGLSEDQIARCLEIKNKNLCRDDDKEEESEVCAICLDDLCRLENNRSVGSLECKHQYHLDCITRWLRVKNFCPLCKAVAFHQDAR